MSDMKCPFCNQELQEDVGYDGDYSCPNCTESYFGSPELWQELIRTRKALDVAKRSLEDCNKILSADMKDWEYLTAEIALKQIEQIIALEQKDK